MKLIVKESIYYALQEALRDDLDPDMQDAIRRIHPEEAEIILDSDHIPATDKIPEVKEKVIINARIDEPIKDTDDIEKLNAIFVMRVYGITKQLANLYKLYSDFHNVTNVDKNVKMELSKITKYIYLLLSSIRTGEISSNILREWYLYTQQNKIPIFKVNYTINTGEITIDNYKVDYYINGNQLSNLANRQIKNLIIALNTLQKNNERYADKIQLELSRVSNITNNESPFNLNNPYYDRFLKNGVPRDLELLRLYYFDKNVPLDLLNVFSNNFNGKVIINNNQFDFIITGNPKEKIKMGNSPFYTSCIDYLIGSHNGQLLLNLFDENSKVALLKTDTGENAARLILRYFSAENTDKGEPLIFIDKYYGVHEVREEFFNLLKSYLDKTGLTYTEDKTQVKKHVFQLKKALDRIGLKSQGSLKLPYMDTLKKMEAE